MGGSTSTRRESIGPGPAAAERGSGVARVSRRLDYREPAYVEKDEPLRLLLVEDTDDDAELVLMELRRAGYVPEVHRVDSGAAFVAALEAGGWDAIVSDHTIPGYGGLAALADLRTSGHDIPFILVSGTIGEAVAVEAMRAGAQDYVLKQDLTRLPVAIARELREKAIRDNRSQMREQLMISERMASAGMLAAGVAHEINNPLAVAVSNVDYVSDALQGVVKELRDLADGSETLRRWDGWSRLEEIPAALRDTSEGLQRIRDIVIDVKLFSRPLDENSGTFDVRKVCDSSARMAWNEIRHRAQLVKEYGDVPPIEANESRVGQVILNLIVNAAQAMPEGRAANNEIRVRTDTDDSGWAVIEVRDTGSGIPQQILEKIFEPFFTTKPVGIGTGLGLAVCRRIVNELGGTIDVDSEVGKGSCFRVSFPPAVQEQPPRKAAPGEPQVRQRSRVLFIDDEAAMGAAVHRALSRHHEVVFVRHAADGLARIAAGERFDVVLSDFMMPDIGGKEMHQRILEMDPQLAKRVVFLTGGAFTAEGRMYLDEIENRVVAKPFRSADLLSVIEELSSST
jgi:signal transduction histidine kinase